MGYFSALKLHNFRCYSLASMEGLAPGLVVLHGPNGAGKTNVLEALSILGPGRGIREARPADIQLREGKSSWAVSSMVHTDYGEVQIGVGADLKNGKRIARVNGESVRSRSQLVDHVKTIWVTPQMDRLFIDSSRERRRFLDRLVYTFNPAHAGRLSRYNKAMAQRSKLLSERNADPSWLKGLETQMAETAVAIAAARLEYVQYLQESCDQGDWPFPRVVVKAKGTLEERLEDEAALAVEEFFTMRLADNRSVDMLTGGSAIGPHKSDLDVFYAEKNMPAESCSTGEQKALLIGIILGHSRLVKGHRGYPPVLLLDEVAAHLDEHRREVLYEILRSMGGQVWLTGTDIALFEPVANHAQFFYVEDSQIEGHDVSPQSYYPTEPMMESA